MIAVTLEAATERDQGVLANLLELYSHDLSDVFGLELNDEGRYGYARLPLYWSEPERRFPLLIRADGNLAGFVLITRGSLASSDPDAFDVAEFFIVRRHRRSGVGRRAAVLAWTRLPGSWVVRVYEGNPGACAFWEKAVSEFTGGVFEENAHGASPHRWRVFSFTTSSSQ